MAKKALKKRDRNIIIAILLIAINIIAIAKWGVLGRFLHNFLRFLVVNGQKSISFHLFWAP